MTSYWRGTHIQDISRQGRRQGRLKSEDFRGHVFYGWPRKPYSLRITLILLLFLKLMILWNFTVIYEALLVIHFPSQLYLKLKL